MSTPPARQEHKGNWRASALQKSLSHRDRLAASLCVRPGCWLHSSFPANKLAKICARTGHTIVLAPSDGATPSRSAKPAHARKDSCWFGGHFRVDLPSSLRCSTFVVDSVLVWPSRPPHLRDVGYLHEGNRPCLASSFVSSDDFGLRSRFSESTVKFPCPPTVAPIS